MTIRASKLLSGDVCYILEVERMKRSYPSCHVAGKSGSISRFRGTSQVLQNYRAEYLTELSASYRYAKVTENFFSSSLLWKAVQTRKR